LFQVMLVYQNAAEGRLKLSGLESSRLTWEQTRANFDLTVVVQRRREALQARFEYNIDLFDADTVARMACHFETLLQEIVSRLDQRISELGLLTAAERRRLAE